MEKDPKKSPKHPEAPHEEEEVTEISSKVKVDEAKTVESQPKASEEKPEQSKEEIIRSLEKERDEFKDKYLRTYADLENFRKRVTREREEMLKFSNEKLLKEILFIKDNLDRALEHKEVADPKTLKEGLELINREFEKLMGQVSVQEIEAIGKLFDPEFHEALGQEESDQPPGTIVREYQKGYLFHEKLLRPASVIVAKKPTAKTPSAEPKKD